MIFNMKQSSVRGIFLSIIFVAIVSILSLPNEINAIQLSEPQEFSSAIIKISSNTAVKTEESNLARETIPPVPIVNVDINAKGIFFENTSIIELTNDSNEDIKTMRIWLGSDFSFKSFKTEKGWVGEKTPQGVIIFTSSESVKSGESVKFGIKTDKVNLGINWKALDKEDKQLSIGKVLPKEITKVVANPDIKSEQTSENKDSGIFTESTFRIVPEKPNVGSSIRVTGDKFGTSQEFDFYINSEKIGSFETDGNGHFMTTMKIPENQKEDSRVDFKIKNKDGEEKKISLRLGNATSGIPESIIKLTIKGLPNVIHRGDFLEIFGTAEPYSAITAIITNDDTGEIINTRTAQVDKVGNWKLDEPIIVALDTPFGKYSATISDGRKPVLKQWTVESDKVIVIAPSSLKFEQGEIMKFDGTALPNKPIEIILEDPLGKEIFSDIIQIDNSGVVKFEFQTELSATKGTYTVIATQGTEKEFIFVGIGQLPTIPVKLEFDKLNYKTSETAIISLTGKGSDIISLLIVDPSDKPKEATSITLQPDGRGTYSLNLEEYSSGIYTAIISKGNTKSSEIFAVGLQTGSGKILINTTKISYLPGDPILILGDTAPNVLLTVILSDPDGNEIKVKETFSDKNGKISESSFRIPSSAESGMWTINAKSGANFDIIEIDVLATLVEGMQISVEKGEKVPTVGETITIKVFGAKQTVEIEIITEDGKIIETLAFQASSQGEINLPWIIPRETEPGIYTVKVSDALNSAETTFELK